jgi:hypothetical protein
MNEVEKHRHAKRELMKILDGGIGNLEELEHLQKPREEPEDPNAGKPDRNMSVCEICGALQSAADTDSRQQMHLEGRLHLGYQKIRYMLRHLKEKKEEYRR